MLRKSCLLNLIPETSLLISNWKDLCVFIKVFKCFEIINSIFGD